MSDIDDDSAPLAAAAPREELRLAVVLNGGVSLAVWMGGAALEMHRLGQGRGVYGALLGLTGSRARIDVIAGTSAGGINGAALALAQANRKARLADLRDIWTDQGQLDTLLRRPFRGAPTSLLQGDEYFLPRLNEAMQRLATPFEETSRLDHPIDLTITSTLLRGAQKVTVDSTGQRLPQWVHAGRFRFVRDGNLASDPFVPSRVHTTADQLALAARATASFPVAFEPAFIPVDRASSGDPADEAMRLRPDMAEAASWASGNRDEPGWVAAAPDQRYDLSRFAVDGGLLANMPTKAALDAVDAMGASGPPVRRVMLLVHPHAPAERVATADDPEQPPNLAGSLLAMLGALSAQGSRTFVEEVEQHNRSAAGRRGARSDVLTTTATPQALQALAAGVFDQYRRRRMWRVGRDVAAFASHEGWNHERIRRNARLAQEAWTADLGADGQPRALPYVPQSLDSAPADGWAWGLSTAIGVADAAAELLRHLVWVLPEGTDYDAAASARGRVSALRRELQASRQHTDAIWARDPVLSQLAPTQSLFTLRIAWYEWLMLCTQPVQQRQVRTRIEALIEDVAEHEAALVEDDLARDRGEDVRRALTDLLLAADPDPADLGHQPGAVGALVSGLVDQVLDQVRAVLPLLGDGDGIRHGELDAGLAAWRQALQPIGDADSLLPVFLALEVATTTFGDEQLTENCLPLELVQLSAQTSNAFATASGTAEDKLGGMAINRFGGFLKRSWRANDWTWGRLDAATVLCRLVLDPARVRRAAELAGSLDAAQPAELAERTLGALLADFFGERPEPPINDFEGLRAGALAELVQCYSDGPIGDLPATMPKLAELAAWAIHMQAITDELPAVGRAVRADNQAGANPRSNGELLIAEHADLISRLGQVNDQAGDGDQPPFTDQRMHDAVTALRAFDRAGIGRESLQEEGTSDQLLRTATSAAAVAATVIDGENSGLPAVKPVTRSVRGGMLLPYWVVTGLTAGGSLSRALALLGLSVGAVLLVLSVFGALPAWASGVGAAFGGSALLVAFAYGALRTGTMLHGIVLLSPVIPLLAFAVQRVREGEAEASAAQGVATLLAVLGLALGLMVLGSLPAPMLSVWGELDRAADKYRIAPVPLEAKGVQRAGLQAWRRLRTLGRMLRRPLGTVALVAVGAAVVVLLVDGGVWVELVDRVAERSGLTLVVAALAAAVGLAIAWWQGQRLQVAFDASEAMHRDAPVWRFHAVRHPAGVVVGWGALYGVGYLLLAAFMLWDPWSWLETWWGKAIVMTALLFAAVLLLVLPVLLPAIAKRRIEAAEERYVYDQLRLGRSEGLVDVRGLKLTRRGRRLAAAIGDSIATGDDSHETVQHANQMRLLRDLVERGRSYRFLVTPSTRTAEEWFPSDWADARSEGPA